MDIPQRMLERWKALQSPGDAGKMVSMVERGYPEMFHRALRIGRCSEEVFSAMAKFYSNKAKKLKQYL